MVYYNINWNITKECNLRCRHCYYDAGDKLDDELSTEEALALVDKITKFFGKGTKVTLGGGEALVRKDVFDIASYGAEKGLRISLASNGLLLKKDAAKKLKGSGVKDIILPIDGIKKTHDALRGKGVFEKAIAAAKISREAGIGLVIDPCIMKENKDEISEIIDLSEELGARQCRFFHYVSMGRGNKDIPRSELSITEYEENLMQLYEEQDKRKQIEICTTQASQYWVVLKRNADKGRFVPDFFYDLAPGCRAAANMLSIKPNGDVLPCPLLEVKAGNVRESGFDKIFGSKVFKDLKGRNYKGKCGECKYNELCGGCRVRAHVYNGDYMGEDPTCSDFFFEPK